jgi:hypothetical protein
MEADEVVERERWTLSGHLGVMLAVVDLSSKADATGGEQTGDALIGWLGHHLGARGAGEPVARTFGNVPDDVSNDVQMYVIWPQVDLATHRTRCSDSSHYGLHACNGDIYTVGTGVSSLRDTGHGASKMAPSD